MDSSTSNQSNATAADITSPDSSPTSQDNNFSLQPLSDQSTVDHSIIATAPDAVTTATDAHSPDNVATVPSADTSETVRTFANAFSSSTEDDIKALTKALTTPIEQIEAEEQAAAAAAAAVAAVAASAAGTGLDDSAQQPPKEPQPETPAPLFDVNDVYNQVLSLTAQSQESSGKGTPQEDRAARALQLIALHLSGAAASASDLGVPQENGQTPGIPKDEQVQAAGAASSPCMEQILKDHVPTTSSAPSVSETLLAISQAISFQSQTNTTTKEQDDTAAFTQAVLSATQADVNKTGQSTAASTSFNSDTHEKSLDQNTLHNVAFAGTATSEITQSSTSAAAASSTSATSSSQGFTFEVDKATGRTQIKWTTESTEDTSNVLHDANAIQQALHTLIANSGIPGLSDLGVANGGLLAPPLGQFPAQGSEFGTSTKGPGTSESAASTMHPPKRRKTGNTNGQNTAASIPEGAASYPCTFEGCGKVFARLYNLKSHSRTHTNERPFICGVCQLAFARNHDLKRHVKIHGGDKPFKCNGCGKSFSRLDALGRHRNNSKNRAGCQPGTDAE
ncbi:hypothetical protein BG011_005297 [Mortierella polycephala]|uniref:C2H2-type domain-containing protein n=1 Tax=Mortierella polycephala TaxID=41804 RepID=A0A9P6U1J1_9FUNG|nr:hypothetical protein BG011_005297 [Mortierella polycephala]